MRRARSLMVTLLTVSFLSSHALADDTATVGPGARVRLTAPSVASGRLVGRILSLDEQTLVLERGQSPIRIPREAVTRLEVSRGRGKRRTGVLIGLAAGGVLGAVLLGRSDCGTPDPFLPNLHELCKSLNAAAPVMGALGGAALGAAIGAASAPGERWQEVPPTKPRIGLSVAPGVARVSVSFGF